MISQRFHNDCTIISKRFHILPARSAAIFFRISHRLHNDFKTISHPSRAERGEFFSGRPPANPRDVRRPTSGTSRDVPRDVRPPTAAGAGAGGAEKNLAPPATAESSRTASLARTTRARKRNRNRFPGWGPQKDSPPQPPIISNYEGGRDLLTRRAFPGMGTAFGF